MMRRYRKKPVEVAAVQWTGSNEDELKKFAGHLFEVVDPEDRGDDPDQTAAIRDTLHNTWVRVYDGQWIAKGIKGEFYPVAEDVFAETYEPVHAAEITTHPAYAQWCATGERIHADLGATNANHASWIPHPFAGEGLPVCAACEQPEGSQIHWHDCAESGCGIPARVVEG
ncbi:hypothetical protein ACFOY2_05225 [Nonomuraea purpurea]|uniref:Uncharacterized protein n=1 Tax=Nonomuraea purpurea TaxID=1849276 RepID=A0ABV8G2L8_9ACTN